MKITFEKYLAWFWASAMIGVGISYSSLYLFHVFLAGLFVFIIVKDKYKVYFPALETRFHYFFYYFLVWYALSIIWSQHRSNAFYYVFIIFCGISLSLSIIYYADSLDKLEKIFNIIKIIVLVEIIISILESLGLFRLPISPYSHIVHFFGRSEASPMPEKNGIFHTPTGFAWNPNNLAVILNIFLPFFLFHKKCSTRYFGAISIFALILITSSRANILTYLFEIVLFFWFFSKRRALIASISFGLSLLIITSLSLNNTDNYILNKIKSSYSALDTFLFTKSKYDDSIGLRQKFIRNGVQQLKRTYYLGVGAGNSGNIEYHQNTPEAATASHISLHNFWIEILVDSGLIFATAFYIWYLVLIYHTKKVFVLTKDRLLKYYSSSVTVSLFGFIPGSISASSVIYDLPMWVLLGFSISVINIHYRLKHESAVIS